MMLTCAWGYGTKPGRVVTGVQATKSKTAKCRMTNVQCRSMSTFEIRYWTFEICVSVRMRRRAGRMGVAGSAIRMGVRRVGRCGVVIVIRLAFLVMMPFGAVLDLLLHFCGRHTRRMIEDEIATELRGAKQDRQTEDGHELQDPIFDARLLKPAPQLPREDGGEDAHGDERVFLVLLHDFVDRLAMVDLLLGELPGDDGCPTADHSSPQRPDACPDERLPLEDPAGEVEQHRAQEQGRREVVERRVQARQVIAEHVGC